MGDESRGGVQHSWKFDETPKRFSAPGNQSRRTAGAAGGTLDAPDAGVWSADQVKGLALALSSSIFIGSSYVVKKKGLRQASVSGLRAGVGGYSYLVEPLWWVGLLTMVVGEIANFAAYAFAPAVLVTPLGALSIIVSAVLAHFMLNERLNLFGILGCILCISGSVTIVLHAPEERDIKSLFQVWTMAMQPGFMLYFAVCMAAILILVYYVAPRDGVHSVLVYVGICSLVGSISVMSVKALGIALKLTFGGQNQFTTPEAYFCILVVGVSVVTQMNYLNKALDLFNTAIVSPIYYVMFTTCTITASSVLFQEPQTSRQIATEACGFVAIVTGTFLLHSTRDLDVSLSNLSQMTRATAAGEEDTVLLSKPSSDVQLRRTAAAPTSRSESSNGWV